MITSGRNSGMRSRLECPAPTSSSTTRKPCSRSASASAPKRPTSSRRASRNSTATLRGSRFDPRTSAASAAGSSSWSSVAGGEIEVQEQQQLVGPGAQAGKRLHRGLPANALELRAQMLGRRHLEQVVRGDQPAVRPLPAGERLHPDDASLANGEDRLEVGDDRVGRQQASQGGARLGIRRFGKRELVCRAVEPHVGVGLHTHRFGPARPEAIAVELTITKHCANDAATQVPGGRAPPWLRSRFTLLSTKA